MTVREISTVSYGVLLPPFFSLLFSGSATPTPKRARSNDPADICIILLD